MILIEEESRKHKTDSLMADGGSLVFEETTGADVVYKEFEKRGSAAADLLRTVGVFR